jgi:amidase
LGAISAVDEKDQASANRPGNLPPDYTRLPESHALQGKRIGVEKSFLKVHEGVDSLLEAALEQMKSRGATIVEVDYVGKLKEADDNEFKVLQYEFKDGLNRYLAAAGSEVKSLKDVIAFNTSHAEKVMPYFRQETLEASEKRGDLESDEYKAALHKVVTVSRLAIDGLLEEHKLQCICGPATGPAWCIDLVNGDSFSGYGMGSGAAMAGYPSISVPLGEVHGLPVGLLFITSAFREAELLSIAYSYEQVSKNRRSPTFRTGML